MNFLGDPKQWKRVMVFALHPDDESLATGGLLQQAIEAGAAVRVVFVTNGDCNPWPQRYIEKRWRIRDHDRARWGARRQQEALRALAKLGVPISCAHFFGYHDQGITSLLMQPGDEPVRRVAEEISNFKPSLLVTPSAQDGHADHNSFAVLLRLAMDRLQPGQKNFKEVQYVIHVPRSKTLKANWNQISLSDEQRKRKLQALLCHETQMRLSFRRFSAYVREAEPFLLPPQALEKTGDHPLQRVFVENNHLHLHLVFESGRSFCRRGTLSLILDRKGQQRTRWSVRLPRYSHTAEVRSASCGALVGKAIFRGSRKTCELEIPLDIVPDAERIFAKYSDGLGFYDIAGWHEVSLSGLQMTPAGATSKEKDSAPVVCCVIPCYNVAEQCGPVVQKAALYADSVLAINDGSTDDTGSVLSELARQIGPRLRVITLPVNCGKGVALIESFRQALTEVPFDVLVTIDADGQHNPEHIPQLAHTCVSSRAAMVVGERTFASMPFRSRFGNTVTGRLLRKIYAGCPLDTQSGMRAHHRSFVKEIVAAIEGRRYETELHILLLALALGRPVETVPIPTIYFNGNRLSHFRPVADSVRIYGTILRWWMRKSGPKVS